MATSAKHALLDELLVRGKLKNDAALARELEVAPPTISKVRTRTLPLGAVLRIRINEVFGMAFSEMRELEAA